MPSLVVAFRSDQATSRYQTFDEVLGYCRYSANPVGRLVLYEVVNLAGSTSLRELCAVLKLCRVLLTNDTGPMHIAAAVGASVVVPFGSTSPELTGPGLPGDAHHQLLKTSAPCAPCFRRTCPIDLRCLEGISVEAVAAAVRQALQD